MCPVGDKKCWSTTTRTDRLLGGVVIWLSSDTRSRAHAVSGQDTVTSDRPGFVTIGSPPAANAEMLMLRELLIVDADDSVEPEVESDELAAW